MSRVKAKNVKPGDYIFGAEVQEVEEGLDDKVWIIVSDDIKYPYDKDDWVEVDRA